MTHQILLRGTLIYALKTLNSANLGSRGLANDVASDEIHAYECLEVLSVVVEAFGTHLIFTNFLFLGQVMASTWPLW